MAKQAGSANFAADPAADAVGEWQPQSDFCLMSALGLSTGRSPIRGADASVAEQTMLSV